MKIDKGILKRYHKGQCTPEEEQIIKQWLESDEYENTLNLPGLENKETHKEKIWSHIDANINEGTLKKTSISSTIMRYAASVLILFSLGLGYYYYNTQKIESHFEISYFESFNVFNALPGKRNVIKLSDGSTVTLNSNSELKAPDSFNNDFRVVYLKGHAHFEISKNPEKPFIIYTDDTRTEVIGTSFDINTIQNKATEIIVTSGIVSFSDNQKLNNSIILKVDDKAIFNSNKKLITAKVDAEKLTAWKDNYLIFENKTLSEIIQVLEPWFDVEFTVKNKELLKQDFKLSIKDPSVKEVMQALSFLGDFSYDTSGNKIEIY